MHAWVEIVRCSHIHTRSHYFHTRVSHTQTWSPLYRQCCRHAGLGRTEVALSRDVGGISTPGVPLQTARAASSLIATLPPPPLQIANTLLNFPACFRSLHCSLHALSCALADCFSLRASCLLCPPCYHP